MKVFEGVCRPGGTDRGVMTTRRFRWFVECVEVTGKSKLEVMDSRSCGDQGGGARITLSNFVALSLEKGKVGAASAWK